MKKTTWENQSFSDFNIKTGFKEKQRMERNNRLNCSLNEKTVNKWMGKI